MNPFEFVSVGLLIFSFVAASPLDGVEGLERTFSRLRNRETIESGVRTPLSLPACIKSDENPPQDCFNTLGIRNYTEQWLKSHSCFEGEILADCFLRQQVNMVAAQCSDARLDECQIPKPEIQQAMNIPAQDSYIASGISAIHNFYKGLYDTVSSGSTLAGNQVDEIANLINPVDRQLPQQLSQSVPNLVNWIHDRVNQSLVETLGSSEKLLTYLEHRELITAPSQEDRLKQLTQSFNTYLTALALNRSGIYATIGVGTYVQALATNGTKLPYEIECEKGPDQHGVCDAWWTSKVFNSSIGLVKEDEPTKNFGTVLSRLFSNITTGERLLDDAFVCQIHPELRGKAILNALGVNTACTSHLVTREWDKTCHANPTTPGDEKVNCEFVGFATGRGFWELDIGNPPARRVPYAYLGPAIAQDRVKLSRSELAVSF